MHINRRQAVIRIASLIGASVLGPRLLAAGTGSGSHGYSASEVALLDEIGDTIIPPTDVPGAKATGIGAFMAMMVNDCYEERDQKSFRDGIAAIADGFRARFGTEFATGKAEDRTAFLNGLDAEQREYTKTRKGDQPQHYFRIMKELTVLGYFSSEIGATQALRYAEVPGGYDGCAPYKKGDRAWYN